MSKKKIAAFIHFNWYWYLVIVLLMSFIFYFVFDIAKKPSFDERIVVFVGIEYIDRDEMEEEMFVSDTIIKEIFVDYSNPYDSYYSMAFSTRGLIDSDILILSEEELLQSNYEDLFAIIPANYLENYISDEINYLYTSDLKPYAIEVTSHIESFVDKLETKYYAVFSKKSDKVGLINSECKNDYAIVALANLFEEK